MEQFRYEYTLFIYYQGRKWLPKTGWANSNVPHLCHCRLAAPSILPKNGWAIAHPAHRPLMPLITHYIWFIYLSTIYLMSWIFILFKS